MRGALKEAELYYKQAIAALSTTPETPERISANSISSTRFGGARIHKRLGTGETAGEQTRAGAGRKDWQSGATLCRVVGRLGPGLGRGEMTAAQQIAEQMLEIAERAGGSDGLTLAHLNQGIVAVSRGELIGSDATFRSVDRVITTRPNFHRTSVDPRVGALCGLAWRRGTWGTQIQGERKFMRRFPGRRFKETQQYGVCAVSASAFYMTLREPENAAESR